MNRQREGKTGPQTGREERREEDGNRVTKVKYAGTLVAHWTEPLLRQHRCPEESSGPYGRYHGTRAGELAAKYHLRLLNAVAAGIGAGFLHASGNLPLLFPPFYRRFVRIACRGINLTFLYLYSVPAPLLSVQGYREIL